MQLTHTRLLVADFDASLRFYRDTLGLGVTLEVPGTYAEFDTGPATLAIYNRALMADVVGLSAVGPGRGGVIATLGVASVDDAYSALSARGLRFVTEPHDQEAWVLRVAHFQDPDGHLLELYQPLGGS